MPVEDLQATFGFEAEFAAGASDLMGLLYDIGLTGSRRLHDYHCSCESCAYNNGWSLRGQHDSSCDGEIISDVLSTNDMPLFESITASIEQAAYQVDAIAGSAGGFHVHVDTGATPHNITPGFLMAEAALLECVSPGAMREQREFNASANHILLSYVNRLVRDYGIGYLSDQGSDLVDRVWSSDRHSNFWYSPRTGTNEFRLWNSTRSAWRMELFVRLSLVMASAQFIDDATTHRTLITDALAAWASRGQPRRRSALDRVATRNGQWEISWSKDELMQRVRAVDERAAELLTRQIEFHQKNRSKLSPWITQPLPGFQPSMSDPEDIPIDQSIVEDSAVVDTVPPAVSSNITDGADYISDDGTENDTEHPFRFDEGAGWTFIGRRRDDEF